MEVQMSKGQVLVLGSNATQLGLRSGSTATVGQYLNETAVPALALLDASAIGLMPGSIAARGCATAGVAVRPGTERFASLITLCTFMCDVPFHLELSVRAYDCQLCSIVPAPTTVDR